MSYGLEVLNAAGATRLSVTDRLTRLVYASIVGPTSSGAASVPGINVDNAVVTAVITDGGFGQHTLMPHLAWITDDTVNWAAVPTVDTSGCIYGYRGSSLILVFRYK